MATDDNVIDARSAFGLPATPTPETRAPGFSQADARDLVDRALDSGADPHQLLEAILGMAAAGRPQSTGRSRPTPRLLQRRAEPATYRLRVDLDGATPPIWRRLDLPSDMTLPTVHAILQVAMGWTDSHLHCFRMGPDDKNALMEPFLTPFAESEGDEGIPESQVRLDEVLARPGQRLFYEYDFGDGWDHTIKLERVLPPGPAGCLDGRRARPPEDCGGMPGYDDIVAALAGDRRRLGPFDSIAQLRDWLPPGWSPQEFDRAQADALVRTIAEGGIPGLPDPDLLDPRLVDLICRCFGTASETHLAMLLVPALADMPGGALADDDEDFGPDADTIAAAVRPLQVVLDVVGDGADLTSAGYLKPAAVEAIFTRLDMGRVWIGAGNREDLTPPVAELRRAAQHLGLLRRRGSRLAPTSAARAVADDPQGLWRHVVSRLPVGSAQQQDPGLLLLLTTAGGIVPQMCADVYRGILTDIDWRGGRFTQRQMDDALTPTWDVLAALGAFEGRDDVTDLGMDLATAALMKL